jgi:hypothetical protein
MNLKKTAVFIIGFVVILAMIPVLFKEPLKAPDFIVFVNAVILIMAGMYFSKYARDSSAKDYTKTLPEIAGKISMFLAFILLVKYGFDSYREVFILKGVLFFTAGMSGIFSLFYFFNDERQQFDVTYGSYLPLSGKALLFKSVIALLLGLLGVFFISADKAMLAVITYVFLTAQLLMIFRSVPLNGTADGAKYGSDELKTTAKIISLILIGAALYLYYLSLASLQRFDIKTSIILFFTGALLFGWADAGQSYAPPRQGAKKSLFFDLVFPILIFAAGIAIFSYKLMDVPAGIHGDETLTVNMAASLGRGEIMPVVLDSEVYNGMSLIYYWAIAVVGKIFGTTIFTARWFSIVTGAAGLVFVYLLIRDIFNRRAAVISSILLSTFFMMVFYSRHALQWIHVPVFAAAAYYFFFKAIKSGKNRFFVIAGIILSLDLCFYSAGKASPFVLIAWIPIMFLRRETRRMITSNWKGIALMFFTMFLIFLPVINYILHHADLYFLRMGKMNYLKDIPDLPGKIRALSENIIRNIQMFMTISANGYCHNIPQKPFFDAFVAFAAVTGAGYLVYTWKKEASAFVILWTFFGLLPGFLSKLGIEDPYPARTVLAIPAVIIVVSIGVERVISKIESLWPKYLKIAAFLCAAYFIAWFSFNNLNDFFVVYPNDPHTQTYYRYDDKINADYIVKNIRKKILMSPFFIQNFYDGMMPEMSTPFYQQHVSSYDVSLFDLSDIFDAGGRPVTIIGEGIYSKLFPIYREYFPDAKLKTIWDTNFWQFDHNSNIKYCYGWKYPDKTIDMNQVYSWFYVYDNDVKFARLVRAEISPEDINNAFSLKTVYYKNGVKSKEGDAYFPVSTSGFDRVILTGLLDVPDFGKYEFKTGGSKIILDDRPVTGALELYKGLHRIHIIADSLKGNDINIQWKEPGAGDFTTVDRKYLINSEKIFGVMVTYSKNGKIIYRELEPSIDFRTYYYQERPESKYSGGNQRDVEWDGNIKIAANDTYTFKLHTLYDAKIILDGSVIYEKVKGVERMKHVTLSPGMKRFRIVSPYAYVPNLWDPGTTVRFMYKDTKHREFMPVTYDMLRP